jgi:hypothetical protein
MLIGGTGTSLGTGNITVTIPFTSTNVPNGNFGWVGNGRYNPTGGNAWHPLNTWLGPNSNNMTVFAIRQTDIGWVTPGTPAYSWVAGSVMNVNITYQI